MRNHLRALVVLLGFSFRAAPRQAAVLFASQAIAQVAALGAVYGVKLVIDAIVRGDVDGAVVAGVFIALAEGIAYMLRRLFYLSREVEERASLLIDQRLMALTTGIPGVEHHERPEFTDQVELLRAQRGRLTALTNAVVSNLVSGLRLVGAAVLLSGISPWLLLLALPGAASVLTGRRASPILERAREASAEGDACGSTSSASPPRPPPAKSCASSSLAMRSPPVTAPSSGR
ncbi:MAG: hypothetical protein HY332_18660 [Chloroflexi bacterium]|nr:hypothetical protein [Chloroflexota bacterium]